MRLERIRVQCHSVFQLGDRLRHLIQMSESLSESDTVLGGFRILFRSAAKRCQSSFCVASFPVDDSDVEMRLGIVWFLSDGGFEFG